VEQPGDRKLTWHVLWQRLFSNCISQHCP
jgi:hypothetical protein